jgi:hypothetical protein
VIYLYGLARPAAALADVTRQTVRDMCGIDGGEVLAVSLAPRRVSSESAPVALIGRVPSAPPTDATHLVEHDRVCTAALMRGCDVLPARFGQLFADDDALASEYSQRAPLLAPLWQKVAHAVEMSLTVSVSDTTPPTLGSEGLVVDDQGGEPQVDHPTTGSLGKASSTGTGYAYLNRVAGPIRVRQRTRARIEPFRADLLQSAGELIRAEAIRSQSVPSVMGLSHLVDRAAIPLYERVVGEVAVAHPLIRVLFSGPNAPYSFVSL